ncbi:retrovirus-related pol polyprotein from transposon TNT 1-94, partial [Tanacetum coccineum]
NIDPDSLNSRTSNANAVCATCGKCVFNSNHDTCVSKFLNDVNARTKKPNVVPISTRKQLHPNPLSQVPRVTIGCYIRKRIVQLILFIVDSGCTKHMTGNVSLLCNFVDKYLGTVRFGNDQFAPILGYGDLIQGNITIKRVYYVEGLNHNLFSVGQFCDADLEVAFRKSTCFVRDLQGNDLLTGNRGSDLYTISLQDTTSSTPICLMAKASPTQAWLWHRRLSHLNFDYINLLSKKDIVIGLPKLKYVKDHLCSSCEVSKAKRSSFKSIQFPKFKSCVTTKTVPIAEHSRNSRSFSDYKHFVCSTCQKCVFNANHDSCVTKFLNEVNSRAKVPSNKTTKRYKPVEQTSFAKKPERQIPKRHRSSIKKTSVVHEKTMTPRSCLRWKPTGKIFKTVGLRWVPTGKIFTSSTTKVDSEPQNGSNADITNQYESAQTLDVSAGTSNLSAAETSVANDTSGLVPQRQKASDYDNPDPAPELQNVYPSADTTVPSQQELDLLFGPLYDEFFNDGTSRVNKSSSPTDNSVPQDTQPSTNIQPTSEPSTPTNAHAEENNDHQAEFTNPFCTPVQEIAESSSRNIGNSNVHTFNQPQDSEYRWTKDHPLTQVRGNPSKPVQTRRQLATDPEMCMFALTVSIVEPKNIKEAMADSAWIEAMQDELHQFDRLQSGNSLTNLLARSQWLAQNRSIKGELYVAQPYGFIDPDHPDKVYRLRKALYGLKQAPRACWMSKKQDCTAISSAEAEYVVLSASCAQVMWMITQLQDYGFNDNKIPLHCDSQSAITISCNPVQHSRTKHIHTRYHFIKEQIENGIIELYFVKTEYQLADMFTKPLLEDRFQYLVRRISMRCLTLAELEVLKNESA